MGCSLPLPLLRLVYLHKYGCKRALETYHYPVVPAYNWGSFLGRNVAKYRDYLTLSRNVTVHLLPKTAFLINFPLVKTRPKTATVCYLLSRNAANNRDYLSCYPPFNRNAAKNRDCFSDAFPLVETWPRTMTTFPSVEMQPRTATVHYLLGRNTAKNRKYLPFGRNTAKNATTFPWAETPSRTTSILPFGGNMARNCDYLFLSAAETRPRTSTVRYLPGRSTAMTRDNLE